jgi:hypothetical protein
MTRLRSLFHLDIGSRLCVGAYTSVASISRGVSKLYSTAALKAGMSSADLFPFIWDTGASQTVTFDINDFVGPLKPLQQPISLGGLSSGITVQYEGLVRWVVPMDNGTLRELSFTAYYTPGASKRLLSLQTYLQTCINTGIEEPHVDLTAAHGIVLTWGGTDHLTIRWNPHNNLPIGYAYNALTLDQQTTELHLCVTDEKNQNLNEAQKKTRY